LIRNREIWESAIYLDLQIYLESGNLGIWNLESGVCDLQYAISGICNLRSEICLDAPASSSANTCVGPLQGAIGIENSDRRFEVDFSAQISDGLPIPR